MSLLRWNCSILSPCCSANLNQLAGGGGLRDVYNIKDTFMISILEFDTKMVQGFGVELL
jgi:hypothetical protein